MEAIKVKITGIAPLLMHSARSINPLDATVQGHKELTGKRKKDDSDHRAIALSEWHLSLYHDDEHGVYLPGENLEAAIIEAAKLVRTGKKFLQGGVMVREKRLPLQYDGPKDPEELVLQPRFVDLRAVRVQQARVMRCRPIFPEWSCEATVDFNPSTIKRADVVKALIDAGSCIGLGNLRPRYGRFKVEID
ncbi:hypothetical protein [Geobacter sp.]|uniref:hypothetical protein n=1 Tax=Geobacter sp. TaxID=46610 RepID=UPI0027B8E26B|nr:hypothetical protein [Geobacter sp.]